MALAATRYREHAPHPALRAHVRVLWELSGPCDDPSPHRLLPDAAMSLWLNFGAPFTSGTRAVAREGAALIGAIRRPIEVASVGALDLVGVSFWPGHARVFFDASVSEVVDRLVAEPPIGTRFASVVDADPGDRIARLQEALLQALRPSRAPSAPVLHALSLLDGDEPAPDVVTLARTLGLGTRQLERRFRDELGASPKQLASVLRFRRALDALRAPRPDFAAIAHRCGYADQSHFVREFARYARTPPARFVATDAPRTRGEWLARPRRA